MRSLSNNSFVGAMKYEFETFVLFCDVAIVGTTCFGIVPLGIIIISPIYIFPSAERY
jgi:hypothetical protein